MDVLPTEAKSTDIRDLSVLSVTHVILIAKGLLIRYRSGFSNTLDRYGAYVLE